MDKQIYTGGNLLWLDDNFLDADYRGELRVNLINHGKEPFVVQRGERIAQMVIGQFTQISWNPVDALDETARGQGGFGSTGV